MNVLSLFDGISIARLALKNLNINCTYYASEIDKYCIQISEKHFPDIIRLSDVKNVSAKDLPKIDLLVGGSPCQDLSIAKRERKGLQGDRSGLFYEYFRIFNECKPDFFLFENVTSMPFEVKVEISELLGVSPIFINSALLTAQNRERLYWTNIKFDYPRDRKIYLKDILEDGGYTERQKSFCLVSSYKPHAVDYFIKSQRQLVFTKPVKVGQVGKGGQRERVYSIDGKSICLSANGGGRGAKTGLYKIKDYVRKLTPTEAERDQGFPDNYTAGVSNTQRYKMIGNSFTLPVIEHILSFLEKEVSIEQLNLF